MIKKKTKIITGLVAGIIIAIAIQVIVEELKTPSFQIPPLDKVLMEVANEINKSCPIMVDAETRLDNTIALPPSIFQYSYTLIDIDRESIDTTEIKKYIEPNIINSVRTAPEMKFYRENNVTLKYYYKDRDGNYLFSIFVTPEQYTQTKQYEQI